MSATAAAAPPPSIAALAQPLRASYAALLVALRLPAAVAAAAESASAERAGLHAWCMRAIQTVTQAAPASRRVGAAASGSLSASAAASASDAQSDASLVLSFLSAMLHLFHMRPQLLDEDEAQQQQQQQQAQSGLDGSSSMDDGASQMSSASVFGGRSLLPFLYAHLFRYALALQQFETYYQLLLHMPAQFAHDSAAGGAHSDGDGSGSSDKLKLECLKRFLIELLRERRTHHLIHQFNWNFPWQPRAQSKLQQECGGELSAPACSAVVGEKSVREEVEAVLWFNAQTSDISDDTEGAAAFLPSQAHNSAAFAQPMAAAGNTATAANALHASHYDLLYSFLLSGHSYLRAAQCMHHFFLRLEAETHAAAGGGRSGETFAKNTVARLKKARGRALSAGPGQSKRGGGGSTAAPSHSEQTQTELSMLTLDAIGRLLRRKLHALVLVRDALQLAARSSGADADANADLRECFMLENDTAASLRTEQEQQLEATQKEAAELSAHVRSPLYKRSRNDLAGASAAGDVSEDQSPFPIASRLDLLSLRAVENRLELVLSQLDMLSVLQSRVALSHAALPVLDPLLDTPVHPAQMVTHLETLVRWGLFDRAFHMVQLFYNVTASGGGKVSAAATPLQSNPLNEPFELASTFLFRELTARICRLHASLLDGEWAEDDVAFPLRAEDSMAELALQGKVARGSATEAATSSELDALRLRDAESVLQLYLARFDALSSGLVFSLAAAEEYLESGAEIPLWLRDRFAAFMDDARSIEEEDAEDEQKSAPHSGLFRMQRSSCVASGHASTLSSFPFLTFLRALLRHGRFELLFVLTARYLDWLAASSTSVAGGVGASAARSLDRSVVSDVLEGFLWVHDQALMLPAGPESKSVQKQTQNWADTLRNKLARIIGGPGAAAAAGSSSRIKAAAPPVEQRVTVGFGKQQQTSTTPFGFGGPAPAVVPAFGASPPAASTTILPVGAVPAPSFTPVPAASPFSGAGFGFGGGSAAAVAAPAPAFSPFASDQSAAAAPTKHAFGGMAPMHMHAQPASAESPAPASTGFSFGGGGMTSSAGLFGAPAPAAAAAAPMSFGGFGASNTINPFASTASIIARAAAAQ